MSILHVTYKLGNSRCGEVTWHMNSQEIFTRELKFEHVKIEKIS